MCTKPCCNPPHFLGFISASNDLCHSLALLARCLFSTLVDPHALFAYLASHLIGLDKCPGVRPIGICETAGRLVSKTILHISKCDLQDSAGPLQLCASQVFFIEEAIHEIRACFQLEDAEAVLLVDASNSFNSLNREGVLHNIQIWP